MTTQCKGCECVMFYAEHDYCSTCRKTYRETNQLRRHYRKYNLSGAILLGKRMGYSLRRIAEVISVDIDDVVWAYDFMKSKAH